MQAPRLAALLLFVLLTMTPARGPVAGFLLSRRFAEPPRTQWGRVLWVTGSGQEAPESHWIEGMEETGPELVVWAEPGGPVPGHGRVVWSREPPPGGGRRLERLEQWQGSLTDRALEALGTELPGGGLFTGPPLVDFRSAPGELSVDLLAANREMLAGKVLVVGAAENLNGPPTPLGPVPTSRALAWGLSAALDGGRIHPVRKLWILLLALAAAARLWRRAGEDPGGTLAAEALGLAVGAGFLSALLLAGPAWLLDPGPIWAGLLGAFVLAPRDHGAALEERLRKALKALLEGADMNPLLESLPEEARESRRRLYLALREPEAETPHPFSAYQAFELVVLADVLEERDAPVATRLEALEWACVKAPEDEEVREKLESCREEVSTQLALLDLESIFSGIDPRYEGLELKGQGTMGLVLGARDVALDRPVALKVVNPAMLGDEDTTGRFWREIEALSQLTHPHIVQVYGVYPGRIPYYAMEFLPGETLLGAMEREALDREARLRCLIQLAAALDHLHDRGVVHRDLKPENLVMVRRDQGEIPEKWDPAQLRLVVIDFGIAKGGRSRPLTQAGDILGTLSYMAPEQVKGGLVDAAADRFAFAVIAYEVLGGKRPFQNPYQAESGKVPGLRETAPDVPEELAAELAALLAADPASRPGDLGRVRDLIEQELFF